MGTLQSALLKVLVLYVLYESSNVFPPTQKTAMKHDTNIAQIASLLNVINTVAQCSTPQQLVTPLVPIANEMFPTCSTGSF